MHEDINKGNFILISWRLHRHLYSFQDIKRIWASLKYIVYINVHIGSEHGEEVRAHPGKTRFSAKFWTHFQIH